MVDEPSRAPATDAAYEKRFGQLEREVRACLPAPLTIEKFTTWLIDERRPQLAASSWRQVRAAARFGLKRSYSEDQRALAAALLRLDDAHPIQAENRKPRTSSNKAKRHQKPNDFSRIVHTALASRSRYGQALADYLQAANTCGLRPCEWPRAVLRPSQAAGFAWELVAPCAKYDEVRATGETRTLRWTQLASSTVSAIQSCIARATEAADEGRYGKLMKRLEELMRAITRDLFPKRKSWPTPYTLRHECRARWTAHYVRADMTDEQREHGLAIVAALLGHASDETATRHYGRPRRGEKSRVPIPHADPAEVAKVRKRLLKSLSKLANKTRGREPRP